MERKYLYGASVQGIQDFIFKTNKLAEIVGASELVEQICTEKFLEASGLKEDDNSILQLAAGNIKCELKESQLSKLEDIVKDFPFQVQQMAPGITISQAVVEITTDNYLQHLEDKLKIQRNKIAKPMEIGFMGLERDRRTGEVAFETRKNQNGRYEFISESTAKKRSVVQAEKDKGKDISKENLFEKLSGNKVNNEEIAFNIEDITKSGKNSWIAVIHADGNGLGQILQGKGKEISDKKQNRAFSMAIENATKAAVQKAFEDVVLKDKENWDKSVKLRYPIRPVVLGGDDLTVIIRADLALDFTHEFLKNFEIFSEKEFQKVDEKNEINLAQFNFGKLTACAGIAFVKKSYPLHYALHLAEELCKDAKKKVKQGIAPTEIPASALAFHKVQDSFIEELEELKNRTLRTENAWDFYAGPYLLKEVEELKVKLGEIEKESKSDDRKTKAVGKLRQIVSESYKNVSTTKLMLKRMKDVNDKFYDALELDNDLQSLEKNETSQLLDLITLHSFNYGDKNN